MNPLKNPIRLELPADVLALLRSLKEAAADGVEAVKTAVWLDGARTGFVLAAILFSLAWLLFLSRRR